MEESRATLVLFDEELTPNQGANLEKELKTRVMDRAELILDIFSTRARTHEAKLQVELAQLEYLLPRLARMWTHLSRIRGGIGLRGPGETQLETDRRMIRRKIQLLREKLREWEKHREVLRAGRTPLLSVALVGYTNAGKSSVLRMLSGEHGIFVEDRLFATLDTLTREVDLGEGCRARGVGHGGVHPQAAAPPGGELPGDARGGPRRRPAAARGGREPPRVGGADGGGGPGAGRDRRGGAAAGAGVQQDGPGGRAVRLRRASPDALPRRAARHHPAARRAGRGQVGATATGAGAEAAGHGAGAAGRWGAPRLAVPPGRGGGPDGGGGAPQGAGAAGAVAGGAAAAGGDRSGGGRAVGRYGGKAVRR
ncbi:MAG: GTPase HflX [Gemmatimonadetes bacterium]|nr:GTPase HflX [Gemmatimonadota bacterium]